MLTDHLATAVGADECAREVFSLTSPPQPNVTARPHHAAVFSAAAFAKPCPSHHRLNSSSTLPSSSLSVPIPRIALHSNLVSHDAAHRYEKHRTDSLFRERQYFQKLPPKNTNRQNGVCRASRARSGLTSIEKHLKSSV